MASLWNRALILSAVALVSTAGTASADQTLDPYGRMNILEENDSLYFHTDKHYTQGLRLSYLAPSLAPTSGWNAPFQFLSLHTPIFAGDWTDRRYALFLGQSIFTPDDLDRRPPDPKDRPYAGWLYGGASLLQRDSDRGLENLELDLGIVGPGALGEQVQNDWHQFIGIHQAQGWQDQLQNEPGAVLSYDRYWRVGPLGSDQFGSDIVPEGGVTVGNVFDYAEAGATLRIGSDLGADYGPARIRPSLSGTDYFDTNGTSQGLGGYFYLGAQGRAVARDLFLDGNTFRNSASVSHKPLVADLQGGLALLWSRRVKVDFSVVRRTEEFYGQRTPDVVGTAGISFSL